MIVSTMSAVAVSTSSIASLLFNVFITSNTAVGVKIVGVNLYILGLLVTILTPIATHYIHIKMPQIEQRAWIHLAIALVLFIATGLVSGAILSWVGLGTYLVGGIASGSIAHLAHNVIDSDNINTNTPVSK